MSPKSYIHFFWLSGLSLIFFAVDRAGKIWAEEHLVSHDVELLGSLAKFHLEHNESLAFSIPFPLGAQIFLSVVLLVFLLVYFFKHPPITFFPRLAVILIFGGALGNLTDRIFFGRVTDFIAIWKFPVWNIADMGIFVGVCIILATEFFASQKNT